MALTTYENDGFERLPNGGFKHLWKWWLWTPMKMVALNDYEKDGFERLWK